VALRKLSKNSKGKLHTLFLRIFTNYLIRLRISFRNAHLSANQKLQLAKREERDLIAKSYQQSYIKPSSGTSSPVPWQQQKKSPAPSVFSREDRAVNASSDLTLALRRMDTMMSEELSKSQFAHDMLRESTEALKQVGESYNSLDSLLSSSKNILGTLLRSQKSDTWYLQSAQTLLIVTIGWLVVRRLLYHPVWYILWIILLPLRLTGGAGYRVFLALRLLGGSNVDLASNSVSNEQILIQSNPATATISGSDAPVINVGNGRSSSARETNAAQDESMTDQVGRIIDESQNNDGTGENAEAVTEDEKPVEEEPVEAERNPKKRMWEEDEEAAKEERRKKDEL